MMRLGLVGCGRLAEIGYAPAARRSGAVEIAAVADPDSARRAAVAQDTPGYGSAAELIAAGGVDALVLATPAAAHLADARLAAGAGLPTLVEKPPAPDAPAARALAELAPPPWIGFNRRFEPMVERLAAAVPSGGQRLNVEVSLRYRRASWSPVVVRDDALLDLGPHVVDLATWLTRSRTKRVRALHVTPGRATLELELEGGTALLECATDHRYRERFEIARESGERIGRAPRGGLVRGAAARLAPWRPHPLVVSLQHQLDAFAAAARGESPGPLGTAAEGARVMAVLDAARGSAAGGAVWRTV